MRLSEKLASTLNGCYVYEELDIAYVTPGYIVNKVHVIHSVFNRSVITRMKRYPDVVGIVHISDVHTYSDPNGKILWKRATRS